MVCLSFLWSDPTVSFFYLVCCLIAHCRPVKSGWGESSGKSYFVGVWFWQAESPIPIPFLRTTFAIIGWTFAGEAKKNHVIPVHF